MLLLPVGCGSGHEEAELNIRRHEVTTEDTQQLRGQRLTLLSPTRQGYRSKGQEVTPEDSQQLRGHRLTLLRPTRQG